MLEGCRFLQSKSETIGIECNNSRQRRRLARFRKKKHSCIEEQRKGGLDGFG